MQRNLSAVSLNLSVESNSQYTDIFLFQRSVSEDAQEECLLSEANQEQQENFFSRIGKTQSRFNKKPMPQFTIPDQIGTIKQKNPQKLMKNSVLNDNQILFSRYINGQNDKEFEQSQLELDAINNSLDKYREDNTRKFNSQQTQEISEEPSKSLKRLEKQKEILLQLDPAIKQFFFDNNKKNIKKPNLINSLQLIHVVQLEKLRRYEQKLLKLTQKMSDIFNQMIKQKKKFEQEVSKMDEINRNVLGRLQKMQDKLQHLQQYYCDSPYHKIDMSFSKNIVCSSNRRNQEFFDNISFAKTFIGSIEELELKKVEEEEEAHSNLQKGLIEIMYFLKKKNQGTEGNISEGLLNRVAFGATLKQWIRVIDTGSNKFPTTSQFNPQVNYLPEFLQLIKTNEDYFIENLKSKQNKVLNFQCFQFSCWLSFIGVLIEDFKPNEFHKKMPSQKQQQIEMNIGILSKILKIIAMKAGINNDENYFKFIVEIKSLINKLIHRF